MNVLSICTEATHIWGQAFAIGAILYDSKGRKFDRFVGRCPIEEDVNGWVAKSVLPQMEKIPTKYASYKEMLKAFMTWRASRMDGTLELVHMGFPVEARLFIDAHDMGIIDDYDVPYPLVDACTLPEIGDSVDNYNAKYGISPDPKLYGGGTHNPLYDSAAVAAAYFHWMRTH